MKILSIRKGFQADHSSTSYEFLAIDNVLNAAQRKDVAKLSSRARPTKKRVSFIYHGDWNDLPGGWRPLVKKYYDVMYSESYDWWTLAMAFKADQKQINEIKKYRCSDENELGMDVESKGDRVIIIIHCCLSAEEIFGYDQYPDQDEDEDDLAGESDDSLLNLLAQNRKYIKKGDYRLLYGVWQKYGIETEGGEQGKCPPKPPGMNKLPQPGSCLLSLLKQI